MNTLYLGDCLYVLRESVPDESVDLVSIDPPFNSKRDYNMFFDDKKIQTQRIAFEDTWTLKNVQESFQELQTMQTENIHYLLAVYQKVAPHAFPYLVMMALRLLELHRVLKPTGSFYLHCDPTMSHYLKTLCDLIFSTGNFKSEISWRRSNPKGHAFTRFASCHDVLLSYAKNQNKATWNPSYREYDEEKSEAQYHLKDADGRRYQLTSLLNPNPARPNLTYKFKGVTKVWRWTKERMLEEDAKGRIIVPKEGKGIPRYKRYLDEKKEFQLMTFGMILVLWLEANHLAIPHKNRKRCWNVSSKRAVTKAMSCSMRFAAAAQRSMQRKVCTGNGSASIFLPSPFRSSSGGSSTRTRKVCRSYVRGIPADEASALKLWKENPFAFQDWWITDSMRSRPRSA